MKFKKVYSCKSSVTIHYKNKQDPGFKFQFSYISNMAEIESDHDFFSDKQLNEKTIKLLLSKGFLKIA